MTISHILMKHIKFKKTASVLLIGFTLLQTGCVALFLYNCIEAGGKVTTESRKENTFTGIDLNIPAYVYVSQGLPQEIRITAKKGVLRQIETIVTDGVLEIEYDTCISNPDSIKIYITIQTIHKLRINGSGDISTLYGITADDLELEINGSGDIKVEANASKIINEINGSGNIILSGSSGKLQIEINGSGDVYALDAPTEHCVIEINGSGDCKVFVKTSLEVNVNGSGDIDYQGSPDVSTSIIGSGTVKKL